jgi:hypothetical protein
MPALDLTPEQATKAAVLVQRFHRAVARDAAVLGAVVRALEMPRGLARDDAERFAAIVSGIVREELAHAKQGDST